MPDLIWLDEEGNEVKRQHKGRGRLPKGFVEYDDDNFYFDPNAQEEPEEPKVKPILIWLDDDGNEVKREEKGRGRPPRGFEKRDDGNYYHSPEPEVDPDAPYFIWLDGDGEEIRRESKGDKRKTMEFEKRDDGNFYNQQLKVEKVDIAEQYDAFDASASYKPPKPITADRRLPIAEIVNACSILELRINDGVTTLYGPIPHCDMGFDEFQFNALYAKIELEPATGQLRIFPLIAPGGPPIVVNDALVIEIGE